MHIFLFFVKNKSRGEKMSKKNKDQKKENSNPENTENK